MYHIFLFVLPIMNGNLYLHVTVILYLGVQVGWSYSHATPINGCMERVWGVVWMVGGGSTSLFPEIVVYNKVREGINCLFNIGWKCNGHWMYVWIVLHFLSGAWWVDRVGSLGLFCWCYYLDMHRLFGKSCIFVLMPYVVSMFVSVLKESRISIYTLFLIISGSIVLL